MSRPSHIVIDHSALLHNVSVIKSFCPNAKIAAVVKADAYGHESHEIAQTIQSVVEMFAVSSSDEATFLIEQGISKTILLLEGCFDANELVMAENCNLNVVLHNSQQLSDYMESTVKTNVRAWVKVDTGMHRLGFSVDEAKQALLTLGEDESIPKPILMTHLASADDELTTYTDWQLQQFSNFQNKGYELSIANSAGIMKYPESHQNWIRPGIMLYGISPFMNEQSQLLKPVMSFESEVIALREIDAGERVGYGSTWQAKQKSVIATIAVGYGDGYPRNAKSGTPVLVEGQKAYLAGRVSMDMICVDVTHLSDVRIGSKVELWGPNLLVNEVARSAETIGYELVTRMPKRVKRIHIKKPS